MIESIQAILQKSQELSWGFAEVKEETQSSLDQVVSAGLFHPVLVQLARVLFFFIFTCGTVVFPLFFLFSVWQPLGPVWSQVGRGALSYFKESMMRLCSVHSGPVHYLTPIGSSVTAGPALECHFPFWLLFRIWLSFSSFAALFK